MRDNVKNVAWLGDEISVIPLGSQLTNPPCPVFTAANGTLIWGSGSAVYVMDGGRRRHIETAAVMADCGYQWGNIDQLSDGLIESVPPGPPLSAAPCP